MAAALEEDCHTPLRSRDTLLGCIKQQLQPHYTARAITKEQFVAVCKTALALIMQHPGGHTMWTPSFVTTVLDSQLKQLLGKSAFGAVGGKYEEQREFYDPTPPSRASPTPPDNPHDDSSASAAQRRLYSMQQHRAALTAVRERAAAAGGGGGSSVERTKMRMDAFYSPQHQQQQQSSTMSEVGSPAPRTPQKQQQGASVNRRAAPTQHNAPPPGAPFPSRSPPSVALASAVAAAAATVKAALMQLGALEADGRRELWTEESVAFAEISGAALSAVIAHHHHQQQQQQRQQQQQQQQKLLLSPPPRWQAEGSLPLGGQRRILDGGTARVESVHMSPARSNFVREPSGNGGGDNSSSKADRIALLMETIQLKEKMLQEISKQRGEPPTSATHPCVAVAAGPPPAALHSSPAPAVAAHGATPYRSPRPSQQRTARSASGGGRSSSSAASTSGPPRSTVVEFIRHRLQPLYNTGRLKQEVFISIVKAVSAEFFHPMHAHRWKNDSPEWQHFLAEKLDKMVQHL